MKFGKLLLIFTLCLFSLIGCKASETKTKNPEPSIENSVQEKPEEAEEKTISVSELPDMDGWSEVSHYAGDVDSDGEDEVIFLMTSAERDGKGEIIWNDGQKWVLYVEDSGQSYVFLEKYIQAGNVYFEVLDYYQESEVEPRINVIISSGTGFGVYSYSFNDKDGTYIEEVVYDTSTVTDAGTNRRFSTLSEIE